jgi:aspartate racemase
MKKLGMVGGIGPESTIDYYRMLIDLHLRAEPEGNYPETLIYSINMTRMGGFISARDFDGLTDYLLDALNSLGKAGADIGLVASNTPHVVFDRLQKHSPIPLVSIVESACEEARRRGLSKLLLLGTAFTMLSSFYRAVFDPSGIELATPRRRDIPFLHEKIMSELEHGILRDDTKTAILDIIAPFKKTEGIDGVILGCTELPLLFPEDELGLPFLNTSRIHVEAAFRRLEV